jgi:hypothetical protein
VDGVVTGQAQFSLVHHGPFFFNHDRRVLACE